MTEEGFLKAQSDNLPVVDSFMVAEFFSKNELFRSAEQRGVKAKRAERESYGDAAVGYVQLKRENNICRVKAKICPEHRVHSKDYLVVMDVNELEEQIIEAQCLDCAASEGGCKHAIAFVMWVHGRSEEPSPTDVESYWKKPKLSGVGTSIQFVTTKDFGTKSEPSGSDPKGEFLKKFVAKGLEVGTSSQILKHFHKDNISCKVGLHQLLYSFIDESTTIEADQFIQYAMTQMSISKCSEAFENTKEQSNSALWHDLRYGRITASKIYEVSRSKTPAGSLVESIIGTQKKFDTPAMQRGRELEKKVLNALEKKLNAKINSCGLMLSPSYPIFGASPDAISADFVVEVKCPTSEKTLKNYIVDDSNISPKFKAQINLQMFLLKKNYGLFCVADPKFEENNKLHIVNVSYDEAFLLSIMDKALLFWKQNIFPLLIKKK